MRPSQARRLARAHTLAELEAAAEALTAQREPELDVPGRDVGERLTHCLLAVRIRALTDDGVELRDAYRQVMAGVRAVLSNDR